MAIPSKGRLVAPTLELLNNAGLRLQVYDDRALVVQTNWQGLSIIRVRPEDIPSIVESGSVSLGITGLDYVYESKASVKVVERLGFGRGRLVLAVPASSGIGSVDELPNGARVATKYVNITREYFDKLGKPVRIVKISGSAEVMPLLGVADAIVDVMSTGTTLRLHGLKPIGVLMESEAVLISPVNGVRCGDVVESAVLMIRGALASKGRKLVLINVPEGKLGEVLSIMPAMEGPTVADIAGKPFKEVISVVPEESLPTLLTRLKRAGAKDILVLDIEKVIP